MSRNQKNQNFDNNYESIILGNFGFISEMKAIY